MNVGMSVGHAGGGGVYSESSGYRISESAHEARLTEASIPLIYGLPAEFRELFNRYPLFLLLLYRERDIAFRDFIHQHVRLLDSLSGLSCLIWLPEPVSNISTELRQRWTERLGTLPKWFEEIIDERTSDFERISCAMADAFRMSDQLPGFIVAEPHQTNCFCDRIPDDDDYQAIFDDLIASAQAAKGTEVRRKTKRFRKTWNWRRKKLRTTAKTVLGDIRDFEKSILEILLPFAPLLECVLSCFPNAPSKP